MKRVIVILFLVTAGAAVAHADDAAVAARKACTDAMNADPTFAESIVKTANADAAAKLHDADLEVEKLHQDANTRVQTNQKHVILAYGAMWIAAAGFVIFLWRRQQALKDQLARLQRELDAALKSEEKEKKA